MIVRDNILDLVRTRGSVSFSEIMQLDGGKGEFTLECGPNIVLWQGLSGDAVRAVTYLRENAGLIEYDPTPVATYLLDGHVLNLPLVKDAAAMRRGYKRPHWLPVVINLTKTA